MLALGSSVMMNFLKYYCQNLKLKTLLKVTSYSLFTIICFAQCHVILSEFLRYPTMINLYDVYPELVNMLPGLTVCNNNRISLKKLIYKNETFRRKFDEKFPQLLSGEKNRSFQSRHDFVKYQDDLSDLFESLNYNPSSLTEGSTMNQLLDWRPAPDALIPWLGCAYSLNKSIDCNRLTRIVSMTDRACTTLLHKGAMLHDLIKRPALFNKPTIFEGGRDGLIDPSSSFDTKEVIKLIVDFEPEDYGDIKRQIGARVIFHDNNQVASTGDLDFYITRGFRYDFSIDRKDYKLLGEPYDHCTYYEANNLVKYTERVEPRVPLGEDTCFQNCVVRNVLRHSNCWPKSMPYYPNDPLDPNLSLKSCSWLRNTQHFPLKELLRVEEHKQLVAAANASDAGNQKSARARPMKTYHKIRRFCWSQCVLSCRMTDYTVTMAKSVWPSDVNVMFDTSGRARNQRHCCALVAVKYLHHHLNVNEYKPKLDLSNTIGDIGGLLAVWLGFSIVSIFRALQKLIAVSTQSRLARRLASSKPG